MEIKEKKIKVIPNPIDNNKFKNLYKKNILIIKKLRNYYGIEKDDFCFLFVGQLIARKRTIETIKIVKRFLKLLKEKLK